MLSLAQAIRPRASVFDKSRRDVVLDITQLNEGKIDADNFFAENYITRGMSALYQSVFRRLEGKSDDGVFRLTQSMGGGKTHNLITLGLLAQYPEYREPVMGKEYKTELKGSVKVIGFSGRENPPLGLWGYLAETLGKKDAFNAYYTPLDAPGQSAWVNLLKGEKVLILLDELPPYLETAAAKEIGASNLAQVTTQALANLFVAAGKEELKNVAIILTDLSGTYREGSQLISTALDNLAAETTRVAKNFTPVEQSSDELYHILRTRLFESLPDKSEIDTVAAAYADEIKKAAQMDITNETPEAFARAVKESYPFHPAIRDLFARFKENPGFMQTRGFIRLMRTHLACMFAPGSGWADKTYLIAPHDMDLTDPDTLSEVNSINPKLANAISNDIASGGNAVAEKLDAKSNSHLASDAAKLLLVSSLATVQNAVRGLKDTEIIRNLCAPGVDIGRVKSEILPELRASSWYLHIDNTGKFLYKNVQNVVAKLADYMKGYNEESIRKEIREKLREVFRPSMSDCYSEVYALPPIDEIQTDPNKVSLVIYQPHSGGLHPDLLALYNDNAFQNRLLFLTGDAFGLSAIIDNASGLKAIEAIKAEFKTEGMATNDPQFIEAEKIEETFHFKFKTAIEQTFVKLWYPSKNGLLDATLQFQFQSNQFNGEEQIRKTLESKRKFTEDITSPNFRTHVEHKLFVQKNERWMDVKKRAATDTSWPWHKPGALESLRESALAKEYWRASGDWIEMGPFPPPKTSVSIRQTGRDEVTGEMTLKITPAHGDTVYWEVGKGVTTSSGTHDVNETFGSKDMEVSFLCVDSTGKHEMGEKVLHQNTVTLRHRFY